MRDEINPRKVVGSADSVAVVVEWIGLEKHGEQLWQLTV